MPTFEEAAEKVIAIHAEAWKDGSHTASLWKATLRDYAHPHIGDKGIDRVTTADVMAVLLPIWTRKHPTAQKVRRRIGVIMKWAIAQGYRADNPAGEAIAAALPKSPPQVEHMRAFPHGEVAGAVAAVRASSAWIGTRLAFEFLVLTAARSGEVRGGEVARDRLGDGGLVDPSCADEGGARASSAAERPEHWRVARGSGPSRGSK